MSVLNHLDVVCRQRRIDLSADDQWGKVARTKSIDLKGAIRQFYEWAVEADLDRSHSVARQSTRAVSEGDRDLGREHDRLSTKEVGCGSAILVRCGRCGS